MPLPGEAESFGEMRRIGDAGCEAGCAGEEEEWSGEEAEGGRPRTGLLNPERVKKCELRMVEYRLSASDDV